MQAELEKNLPAAGTAELQTEIGKLVDDAMVAIERDNVRLQRACELDRLASVGRPADDLDPRVAREHRLERLCEETMIVRDQHANRCDVLLAHLDPNAILPV